MTDILSTFFRGLLNVVIVTAVVALTWSVYIYREPIASTLAPVTGLFKDDSDTGTGAASAAPAATTATSGAPAAAAKPADN